MPFTKLTVSGNNYSVNRKVPFRAQVDLGAYVKEVFEFAFGMTFGKTGHHRTHRTGGQYGRKNGDLFINAFQGKLAEFGVWELLRSKGVDSLKPDLEQWDEGVWDDGDLIINGKHIPNIETGKETIDIHLFTGVSPDGKKLMKSKKWMYLNEIDKIELYTLIRGTMWQFDCPGFISEVDLKDLIANRFFIPQNAMLNGWVKMDASNYYCQAGDLRSMDSLIPLLR